MIKRGQVTIFIIVGIVILAAFATILFLVKNFTTQDLNVEKEEALPSEIGSVSLFVENCLKNTGEEAIIYNFINGGFYLPDFNFQYQNWKVPYYFYLGEDLYPNQTSIEQGINEYVQNHISDCLNDFIYFKSFQIKTDKPLVQTSILESKVKLKLDLPMKITSVNQTKEIKFFEAEINVPLRRAVLMIGRIAKYQKLNPNEIMLTKLVDDSAKNNYSFKIYYQKDEIIYLFTFENLDIKNKPLKLQFAAKYDWFGEMNQSIDLKPIGKQTAIIGKEFVYLLQAIGSNLTFMSNQEITFLNALDFYQHGKIRFVPTEKMVGKHFIVFSVKKDKEIDNEVMILEVKDQ